MAHLVLEDLPHAAVDCTRFTLLGNERTPSSLCCVSALSLELSAVCEVGTSVLSCDCTYNVIQWMYVCLYVCMCVVFVCCTYVRVYMYSSLHHFSPHLSLAIPGAALSSPPQLAWPFAAWCSDTKDSTGECSVWCTALLHTRPRYKQVIVHTVISLDATRMYIHIYYMYA